MVDVWLNQTVWATPDGYIWTYGTPRKSEYQTGANRIGKVNTNINTTGCVKNLYLNNLYISGNNTSQNYLYLVNPEQYVGNALDFKTNLYTLPHRSTISCIHVYFSSFIQPNPLQASGLTFNLYSGYESIDYLSSYTIPALPTAGRIIYFPITKTIPDLDTFYLHLNQPAGVGVVIIIKKLEIDYYYTEGDI